MAGKPILFSGPMVRALLDGRKTQTRRVLKAKSGALAARSVLQQGAHWIGIEYDRSWPLRLSYATGDRLWVRETFVVCEECGYEDPCEDANSAGIGHRKSCRSCDAMLPKLKTPSIFMPRRASRLTLIVTDVRVQRLQEISEADALSEGSEIAKGIHGPDGGVMVQTDHEHITVTPYRWYRELWNSLHGPEAWAANPWVCAMTFTVHRCNIDRMEANHG